MIINIQYKNTFIIPCSLNTMNLIKTKITLKKFIGKLDNE